jgi:hypothetical protein
LQLVQKAVENQIKGSELKGLSQEEEKGKRFEIKVASNGSMVK